MDILVAEDNAINQKLIGVYLSKMGHSFDIAENGQETLDMLSAKSYDLLLLDIQMPIKSGLEVLAEIREAEPLKDLYVIALTANALAGDEEHFLEADCNDYISKPIDRALLEEKIKKSRET